MNIKEILESYYETSCALDAKRELVMKLKKLAKKVAATPKAEEVIAKIRGVEEEINTEISRLVTVTEKVLHLIACLEDSKKRTVLERKYLLYESYEAIGNKMGYCSRQIIRIHNQAIEELERKANL